MSHSRIGHGRSRWGTGSGWRGASRCPNKICGAGRSKRRQEGTTQHSGERNGSTTVHAQARDVCHESCRSSGITGGCRGRRCPHKNKRQKELRLGKIKKLKDTCCKEAEKGGPEPKRWQVSIARYVARCQALFRSCCSAAAPLPPLLLRWCTVAAVLLQRRGITRT